MAKAWSGSSQAREDTGLDREPQHGVVLTPGGRAVVGPPGRGRTSRFGQGVEHRSLRVWILRLRMARTEEVSAADEAIRPFAAFPFVAVEGDLRCNRGAAPGC